MGIDVTPCASIDEVVAALGPIMHYFGGRPTPEDAERFTRVLEVDRMHAAREHGATVGGAGAFTFELTVPGGLVRAAGTTVVGVLPSHRRRGVLRAMMRAQLDDIHARGEPVAYLWASEETIYGRFGYGMASLSGDIDLPKAGCALVRPSDGGGEIRFLGEAEALEPCSQIYDRARRRHPGMFARSADWWTVRRLADPENRRHGGGVLNRVALFLDGKPEAYALYRMHQGFEAGATTGHVNVLEAVGATPEATRRIWAFLLNIDWVARLKASLLPVDHPLFFMLQRPRLMRFRVVDALWVRLVDVPAALGARARGEGPPVVLEVHDAFCPWNDGRYRVGAAGVERTTADPDVSLDVTALGAAYFGAFRFSQLAAGGRIEERAAGGLARADAIFRWEHAPWCPEIF